MLPVHRDTCAMILSKAVALPPFTEKAYQQLRRPAVHGSAAEDGLFDRDIFDLVGQDT